MLTDYVLAVLTLYFAVRLLKVGQSEQQNSVRLWGGAFITTAIAAVAGGTSHGFALYLGEVAKVAIWKTTVYAIGLASFFMLSGTIISSVSPKISRWLLAATVLKFLVYAVWMVTHNDFRYVIIDYVPAMFGVILLQLYAFVSRRDKSVGWIIAGVLVSFVAAGIQQSGFTIHQHFNYNDLYHVIQMGAIYLLFRGAFLLRDRSLRILMGLVFYPRGGSAQVVRYLSQALMKLGHQVHLVTGSIHDGNPQHDAREFYRCLPLTEVDYTMAWRGFERGLNPISEQWEIPFHPSYEDKPDVPDRVFCKVSQSEYEALLRCWKKIFKEVNRHFQPRIVHLHHLNHMHLAAEVLPKIPKVTQFHGTEIKMLENAASLNKETLDQNVLYEFWHEILHKAVQQMHHYFAISADVCQRAKKQFSLQDSQITTIPNGVDVSIFKPLNWSPEEKLSFLRKILVLEPRGWDENGEPGSIRYTEADLKKFKTASGQLKPLLIYVGRFLDFKRVPLLIEAVAKVNQILHQNSKSRYNLLVCGGMPGEWEGQHPHTLACQLELSNVFFAGWLPHSILSQGLNLADVFVAPSYYEPFGQVFLEAMATGLPVIATHSGGPLSFVVDSGSDANGWFCEVDDVESLAQTICEAMTNVREMKRRGKNALALIQKKYNWTEIAKEYVKIYEQLVGESKLSCE